MNPYRQQLPRDWTRSVVDRVTAKYRPPTPTQIETCGKPAWDGGPPCTLAPGHPTGCAAPSAFPSALEFDGPIPSSTYARTHKTYHVTVRVNQPASCTCEGFTKYNRGRDCSHITMVRNALREGSAP